MERNRKVELLTIIGRGSSISGTLRIKGGVKIDGEVVGTIETDGFLTLGVNGIAKANIKAKECLITGRVDGDLYIQGALELEKTAVVNGNIHAKTLRVNLGAKLNGNCSMNDQPKMPEDKLFYAKTNDMETTA
jgi:cytoskeletal protein CcmA (bactofilin family)